MDLSQLLNLKVDVASKEELNQSHAPGTVTVYTKKDIENLGYFTLQELASITPGYSSANIHAGQVNLIVRGQKVTGFDNSKVLLLIDGLPFHSLRNNKIPTGEDFSLVGVEKVEFMRGAGSALYGTSAFYGVISVQTSEEFQETSSIDAYVGQYGTHGIRAHRYAKSDSVETKLRVSTATQAPTGKIIGYSTGTQDHDNSRTRSNSNFDRSEDLFVDARFKLTKGSLKDLELGYINSDSTRGTFETEDDSSESSYLYNGFSYRFKTSAIFAKYSKDISDKLTLKSHIKNTRSIVEGSRYYYALTFDGVDSGVSLDYELDKDFSILVGTSYDIRNASSYDFGTVQADGTGGSDEFVENGSSHLVSKSAYLQLSKKYPLLNGLFLVAGTRYDSSSSSYSKAEQVLPRFSAVQSFSENFIMKYLYSTSLKSPDLKATLINAGIIEEGGSLRQEKLDSEKAYSQEVSFVYTADRYYLNLSLSEMRVEDSLNREDYLGENPYENSTGETKSRSLELEFKYVYNHNFSYFFNYTKSITRLPSINDNSNLNGQEADGVPESISNLGLTYNKASSASSFIIKHINSFMSSGYKEKHEGFTLCDFYYTHNVSGEFNVNFKAINLFNIDARVQNFQEAYLPQKFLAGVSYNY
jgi:outer membrane receptor for ferrienterochelin and colicin